MLSTLQTPMPHARSIVYPGITAMGNDCGIQPISYYKKTEAELTEFQKIKRRLSMKVGIIFHEEVWKNGEIW